jgi:hypothetical protein
LAFGAQALIVSVGMVAQHPELQSLAAVHVHAHTLPCPSPQSTHSSSIVAGCGQSD